MTWFTWFTAWSRPGRCGWWKPSYQFAWCYKQARRNHPSTVRLPPGQVELPKHILKCPNINGHLAKMTVPYFQTNNLEEEIMLHAEAHKRKFTFSIGYALACGLIFEGCFSITFTPPIQLSCLSFQAWLCCHCITESASKSALSEKGAKSLYKPTIFPLLFSSTVYFQLLWLPSL